MTDRSKRLIAYLFVFALGILVGTAWAAQVNLFPSTQCETAQRAKVVRAVIVNHAGQAAFDNWTNAQRWQYFEWWLVRACREEVYNYYHREAVASVASTLGADHVAAEAPDLNGPAAPEVPVQPPPEPTP